MGSMNRGCLATKNRTLELFHNADCSAMQKIISGNLYALLSCKGSHDKKTDPTTKIMWHLICERSTSKITCQICFRADQRLLEHLEVGARKNPYRKCYRRALPNRLSIRCVFLKRQVCRPRGRQGRNQREARSLACFQDICV